MILSRIHERPYLAAYFNLKNSLKDANMLLEKGNIKLTKV